MQSCRVLLEVNKLAEWLMMNFCVHDLARANARSWPFIWCTYIQQGNALIVLTGDEPATEQHTSAG